MAVANYESTYGHFPPPYLGDEHARPLHSWRVLLLPYIEQQELYDRIDFTQPWDSPANRPLASPMPQFLAMYGRDKSDTGVSNYLAVVGEETVWPEDAQVSYADIGDGSSNTAMIVENVGANVPWMEPRDLKFREMDFTLGSPNGISSDWPNPAVLMADHSVHSPDLKANPEVVRAMLTANGGEAWDDDGGRVKLLPEGRKGNPPE